MANAKPKSTAKPQPLATPPATPNADWLAELVAFVAERLKAHANAEKAAGMQAYLKSAMPCFGVYAPDQKAVARAVKQRFPIATRDDYEAAIRALWAQPHREEKHMALAVAMAHPAHIVRESMPLFEQLIREGAWWDFVDTISAHLSGIVWKHHRAEIAPIMDAWIADDNFWIRRAAIIGQIKHKAATDHRRLFRYCLACAAEKEFFIRKAIGWALREFSYTDADRVREFLTAHKATLSGLSYREGAKALVRRGLM